MRKELTSRQVEILRLVAHGWKDREIAWELFISTVSVKSHLQNIFKSLHATCRTDAIVKAHREGYINLMECK